MYLAYHRDGRKKKFRVAQDFRLEERMFITSGIVQRQKWVLCFKTKKQRVMLFDDKSSCICINIKLYVILLIHTELKVFRNYSRLP
jgi:hypothetical protein